MDITNMTTTTLNAFTSKSIVRSLRNANREQVLNLDNGARIVYYPAGSISTEAGHKNCNSKVYKLICPNGSYVEVTNLTAFCKSVFGVTEGTNRARYVSSFCDMFNGIRKEDNVQGWKAYKEPQLDDDTEAMELMAA